MSEAPEYVIGLVTKGQAILLLRQAQRGGWEFPAGRREPGEDPATGVLREVLEETGLSLQEPIFFGHYTPQQAPYSPHLWHVFWLPINLDLPEAWVHVGTGLGGDAGTRFECAFHSIQTPLLEEHMAGLMPDLWTKLKAQLNTP